jgi:hypothetical protein
VLFADRETQAEAPSAPPVETQPQTTTDPMNNEAPAPVQVVVDTTDSPIPPLVQIPVQQHVSVSSIDPALQAVRPTLMLSSKHFRSKSKASPGYY